jgi:hypothetical protein
MPHQSQPVYMYGNAQSHHGLNNTGPYGSPYMMGRDVGLSPSTGYTFTPPASSRAGPTYFPQQHASEDKTMQQLVRSTAGHTLMKKTVNRFLEMSRVE